MNVPKLDAMLRPILALSVDAPITRAAATESMALHFGLFAEDRQARIPSGRSTYVRNRTGWAMTFLTKGGLIVKVAPKQYRITERGRAFLAAHPEEITTRDLEAIDGWEEAWNADTPGDRNTPVKDEPVWNCEEAAVFLRIHPKTVKRLASMGSLPGFRIGNRWRFRPSELDAWAHSGIPSNHSLRRE
jgi:excisionase family DNA binding protein